jgi:hypothetical protein
MEFQSANEDDLLFRGDSFGSVETLFIIGNGALSDGNKPLEKALKQLKNENHFFFDSEMVGTTSSLSCLVANETSLFNSLQLKSMGALPPCNLEDNIYKLAAFSGSIRIAIGESYQEETLFIRPEVARFLNELGIKNKTSVCVTTNWDNTLWQQTETKNVIYLHGRCSCPFSMILPTEMVVQKAAQGSLFGEERVKKLLEPYANNVLKEEIELLTKYYHINEEMFKAENLFTFALGKARRIIFVGIRFNDYDHELMNCISNAKIRATEFSIISSSDEKEKKKTKVAGLVNRSPDQIDFFDSTQS